MPDYFLSIKLLHLFFAITFCFLRNCHALHPRSDKHQCRSNGLDRLQPGLHSSSLPMNRYTVKPEPTIISE